MQSVRPDFPSDSASFVAFRLPKIRSACYKLAPIYLLPWNAELTRHLFINPLTYNLI